MADEDAERDTYLSWDAFRQRIAESFLSEEGRAAAVWAVDVLAPVLGDEWFAALTKRTLSTARFSSPRVTLWRSASCSNSDFASTSSRVLTGWAPYAES